MQREEDKAPRRAMAVYVEDTLLTRNNELRNITEQIPKIFEPIPKEFLPFIFLHININKERTRYIIEQEYYANNLE